MRRYETIFILDPDLAEEGRASVLERVGELIPRQGGTLLELEQWGPRKLAYAIRKKVRGFYVRADYCGGGSLVDEMERFFKIDDRVLKYMTIQLDEAADVDRLLAEKAKADEAPGPPGASANVGPTATGAEPAQKPEPAVAQPEPATPQEGAAHEPTAQ